MADRRAKRKAKRKKKILEEIPCIIFLSSTEKDSFDLAERKENKQLKYISEYADAHGLVPVRIVRRGCMGRKVSNDMFLNCIRLMENGRANAILVANMDLISTTESDAYYKVGLVREKGFRMFSVDEGELKLELKHSKGD
jgi:hypothetical protein